VRSHALFRHLLDGISIKFGQTGDTNIVSQRFCLKLLMLLVEGRLQPRLWPEMSDQLRAPSALTSGSYSGICWAGHRLSRLESGPRRSISCCCVWHESGFSRREDVSAFNLLCEEI
jgi:hypothetical protein